MSMNSEWTEAVEDGDDIHSYESHNLPEGTVPDDVVGQTHDASGNRFVHYRLNPDYDASCWPTFHANLVTNGCCWLAGQVKC